MERAGFLEQLLERSGEIPFFLRDCLHWFAGSSRVSLDDFFWIGGEDDALHPYLENGLVALVNRRRRLAQHFAAKPLWQQPIYVIVIRDGKYLAACCGREDNALVIHPHSQQFHPPAQFRHGQDAEVVGQIVAIARILE